VQHYQNISLSTYTITRVPSPSCRYPVCQSMEPAYQGYSIEATPARCATKRESPFRIAWRMVVYAAHLEQRIPWSTESLETLIPHKHWTGGVLAGMVLAPRRCHIRS
jgi:hypothetical protein